MQNMTIRLTDAAFVSVCSDREFASIEDGYKAAVQAALSIAAEELASGSASVLVEIAIDTAEKPNAARGAVSVSTARLAVET